MTQEIMKMKSIAESVGIPKGKLTDEYMFTLVGMNYYYYNNNLGSQDIIDGFVDGAGDGGIDFIFSDNDTMYLVQGKSSNHISIQEIKDLFYKMHDTVNKFEREDYDSLNQKLQSQYLNTYDSFNETPKISLVLFTNADITEKTLNQFYKEIDQSVLNDYIINIYDGKKIQLKALEEDTGPEYVEQDKIFIDEPNKILNYEEIGIIANVKASSLKTLFVKHKDSGLFSYNLREYITQKSVDSGIEKTIQNEPENFWYYNNGVTFVCEDYHVDGNNIKLYNFSIINGAQTTTKIGNTNNLINKDFYLVAKIVKIEQKSSIEQNKDFIGKISEASNSQKPIRPRDLKANRAEQKLLQVSAKNHKKPLAIRIKRGVKPENSFKVEKWQRVENEYIGQLILSVILQRPGTARSGKRGMFDNDKIYNQVFKRKMDYDTLYDLVKLGDYYEQFKIDFIKDNKDINEIAIVRNGKFVLLGIVGYMLKRKRNKCSSYYSDKLKEDNLNGTLISKYKYDDMQYILNQIFRFFIRQLKRIYEVNQSEKQLTSYSNFFKTDKHYQDIILSEIDSSVYDDEFDKEKIENNYYKILDD